MRRQGRIVEWNDARGFGFILWNDGNERAFAHIRDFTHRKLRPSVGDAVSYEQVTEHGRPKATGIAYAGVAARSRQQALAPPPGDRRPALAGWLAAALLLAIVAGLAWHYRAEHQLRLADERAHRVAAAPLLGARDASPGDFRCDGRQHCAQMTSCDEARWFVAHCPDTRMDGDGDGEPCEGWCR